MTVPVDRDRLRRTTAPHLLCERARTMPDSVAFRSKHFGIYRERRWRDRTLPVDVSVCRRLLPMGSSSAWLDRPLNSVSR
jgi:hypothetical protein